MRTLATRAKNLAVSASSASRAERPVTAKTGAAPEPDRLKQSKIKKALSRLHPMD